jgi:hypothetical protein
MLALNAGCHFADDESRPAHDPLESLFGDVPGPDTPIPPS